MRARVCSFLSNFPILGPCPVSLSLAAPPPPSSPMPLAACRFLFQLLFASWVRIPSPVIPPPSIVWTCEMSAKSRPKLLARFVGRLRFQQLHPTIPYCHNPAPLSFRSCGIPSPGRDAPRALQLQLGKLQKQKRFPAGGSFSWSPQIRMIFREILLPRVLWIFRRIYIYIFFWSGWLDITLHFCATKSDSFQVFRLEFVN